MKNFLFAHPHCQTEVV